MNLLKYLLLLLAVSIISACANSQQKIVAERQLVGGPCEGCEAVFEYGDRRLSAVDTLPGFATKANKLKVSGTIYASDGKPAPDVILYVYHTNESGSYRAAEDAEGWARRHGSLRGWVKTDKQGRYTFYTSRPAPYPFEQTPAHIHATILEPNGKYYWIEDFYFEGDVLLVGHDTREGKERGGAGNIIRLDKRDGILWGMRDIHLGKNIEGY